MTASLHNILTVDVSDSKTDSFEELFVVTMIGIAIAAMMGPNTRSITPITMAAIAPPLKGLLVPCLRVSLRHYVRLLHITELLRLLCTLILIVLIL